MELGKGEISIIVEAGWGSGHLWCAQGVELAGAGPIEGVGKRIEVTHENAAWMGERGGTEASLEAFNLLVEGSVKRNNVGGHTHLLGGAEKAIRAAAKSGAGSIASGARDS